MGNPIEFTIKELAENVKSKIVNSKSEIIYQNLPEDDPKKRCPDISLAKKEVADQYFECEFGADIPARGLPQICLPSRPPPSPSP